jgi:hypothetical protein
MKRQLLMFLLLFISFTLTSCQSVTPNPTPILVTATAMATTKGDASMNAEIIVNNTTDDVNGDISSPEALYTNPGMDGISLREAVEAANNADEPQTILFSNALAGKSITLFNPPLSFTREGTTLNGLTDSDGQPALTLDAREVTWSNGFIYILASNVIVRHIKVVGIVFDGISILVGSNAGSPLDPNEVRDPSKSPTSYQDVSNVFIEDNIFVDSPNKPAGGSIVRIYMEPEGESAEASIDNVHVIRNTFQNYSQAVAVNVAANGINCHINEVVIADNLFTETKHAIVVETAQGSDNQIFGTKIMHNTILSSYSQPTLFIAHLVDPKPPRGYSNSRSIIDETLIDSNYFLGSSSVLLLGGQDGASECVVSNTSFINNVVMSTGDFTILGGKWEATGNRIEFVNFFNNTFLVSMSIEANADGGRDNSLSGLAFTNTIFGTDGYINGLKPDQVNYSLIELDDFWGNHNKVGDPKFVNLGEGDFHLLGSSPAIDVGTIDGIPETDLECRPRDNLPDLGAFEYGAPAVKRLFLGIESGIGTIDSSPDGFECGSARSFLTDSIVILKGNPASGWRFSRWGGDADCLDGSVTMSADIYCEAFFELSTTPKE